MDDDREESLALEEWRALSRQNDREIQVGEDDGEDRRQPWELSADELFEADVREEYRREAVADARQEEE
jgi:hypothetical protein